MLEAYLVVTGQLLTAYRVREGHDISTAGTPTGGVQRGRIQGYTGQLGIASQRAVKLTGHSGW